jgi:hypothetical protein
VVGRDKRRLERLAILLTFERAGAKLARWRRSDPVSQIRNYNPQLHSNPLQNSLRYPVRLPGFIPSAAVRVRKRLPETFSQRLWHFTLYHFHFILVNKYKPQELRWLDMALKPILSKIMIQVHNPAREAQ